MKFSASYIIAASQLFAVAFGAPLFKADAQSARSLVARAAYKVFGGDGTVAQGWPSEDQWASFEEIWAANKDTMSKSCTQFGQENNSADEIASIKSAITDVASKSGIASHFLLAFMIQESKGCVRAPTTNYGVNNPGLMQSFNGQHSCNPDGTGVVPCPADTITGMVSDGAGIGLEFGLGQAIEQSGASDVSKYYKAARIYNSGSVAASGNLGDGIATHCYASDIANRLMGWASDAGSECDEATIGSVTGTASSGTTTEGTTEQTTPETETEGQSPTETTPQTPSTSDSAAPSGTKAEGASANCTKWYKVKSGDTCSSTGVDVAKLVKLNTSLKSDCSNLMAGSAYCVAA
ncbi:hypothetical protein K458DRAFT_404189 [Lentithecium fluviatile CBS 122367]|uniref:LysM domain-containing protein n=1 Tax=Lentithecium fluviatile CBS 122367 TaxID=1168545 RepID=A0A6G1J300_9PLEO|nr:hypothetical protein K458DRAFT_404189 [Lentithecium fluviatile CBS 122367]